MLRESEKNLNDIVDRYEIDAGDYWLGHISKGQSIRLTDLHGNQAIDTLFFNDDDPFERYSAFDTIREQNSVYLTAGSVLLSDENRPMLEITADTCGRHDTLGGACAGESNTVRYALEKKTMHSCRDSWLLALTSAFSELGLTKRDLTHNVNFFMNVPITSTGGLTFEDGVSGPGKYVELLALMNIMVLISNCPQLNNPCNGYNPTPVEVAVWDAEERNV
ncbi:MAG: urea amidolyase associated protein UAAP2 [Pseudomonadota bacterium]